MKLFYSKYNDAQYWINTLTLREQKKQAEQGLIQPVSEVNHEYVPVQEVVFTHEDTGHTTEEAQQIQNIYAKLKGFGFAASYAGY